MMNLGSRLGILARQTYKVPMRMFGGRRGAVPYRLMMRLPADYLMKAVRRLLRRRRRRSK